MSYVSPPYISAAFITFFWGLQTASGPTAVMVTDTRVWKSATERTLVIYPVNLIFLGMFTAYHSRCACNIYIFSIT